MPQVVGVNVAVNPVPQPAKGAPVACHPFEIIDPEVNGVIVVVISQYSFVVVTSNNPANPRDGSTVTETLSPIHTYGQPELYEKRLSGAPEAVVQVVPLPAMHGLL